MNWRHAIWASIARVRHSPFAQEAAQVFAWNVIRLGLQLAWVITLARSLGVKGYGEYIAVAAMAIVLGGLSGLGFGMRLYQDGARTPAQLAQRWSQTVAATWISGVLLTTLFLLVANRLMFSEARALLLPLALAEIAAAPWIAQYAFLLAATGRIAAAAAVPVALAGARLVAATLLWSGIVPASVSAYAWFHMLASALAVGLVALYCRITVQNCSVAARVTWADVRASSGFASLWASGLAQTSLDKTAAYSIGGATVAGNYSAGQRFASLLALPIDTLLMAALPRLFRAANPTESRIVKPLFLTTLCYGAMAGSVVAMAAPLLPLVLGRDFLGAIETLRILGIYVPIYCLRVLAGNLLLAAGLKRWRIAAELTSTVGCAVLMFNLIPEYSEEGAALSLVCAEAILAALLWGALWRGKGSR